ncbi:LysE family translocator [Paraferrimonas haliotis]|uniref:Amino acid efflux permease RhtB family protein n=1 Tax=Paraferrimonas haliotis TaxID=2013866 RepID=A0AA37TQ02_9GAMM|nr:LysE family translocator [Paraferrimonas haliotis]GLS82426.1 amino acid efflux permease RhtB family protein [Paraferrimonas haliotis]
MSFSLWVPLFLVCLLGAVSPGPSLAMVLRHTLSGGRTNGVVAAWTHALGIGVYAAISVMGLAILVKAMPNVYLAVTLAGAMYLFWLGWQGLMAKQGIAAKLAAGEQSSVWEAARDGLAVSLLNPKILIFFIALFSPFVDTNASLGSHLIVIATPLLVDGLWYTLVALLLSHSGILPKLRAKANVLDKLSGLILVLLAARVVWQALF